MARNYPTPIVKTTGPYTVTLFSADKATVSYTADNPADCWTATVRRLLGDGDSNPKTELNVVETRGFSMTPHKLGGLGTVCSFATTCIDPCLNETGQGPMNSTRRARLARYALFFIARDWLVDKLIREIRSFGAGLPAGDIGGVRLNMFSDIAWERYGVIDALPDNVVAYDYTKNPKRAAAQPYNLTYSYDGTIESEHYARTLLARGINVAAVFHENLKTVCGSASANQRLPERFLGVDVIDGTLTDWRPADPKGVVVGLKLKARTFDRRNMAIDAGFSADVDALETGDYSPVVGYGRPLVAI